jgi:hypothetical protein
MSDAASTESYVSSPSSSSSQPADQPDPPRVDATGADATTTSPGAMPSPSPPPRTIDDVAREDAAWRLSAAARPHVRADDAVEGAALRALLSDYETCVRCEAVAGAARWRACYAARAAITAEETDDEETGFRVAAVMDALDAPHLRPTGMRARLEKGVDATCHGVVTLLSNLSSMKRHN